MYKNYFLLRLLRGDRRIPFGFRHVPLEAASVESSGVQRSTANYVELVELSGVQPIVLN